MPRFDHRYSWIWQITMVQDAARGVQPGVEARQRGGQHHEIHNVACGRYTDGSEERDERLVPCLYALYGSNSVSSTSEPN
jgi:hypothetical protein